MSAESTSEGLLAFGLIVLGLGALGGSDPTVGAGALLAGAGAFSKAVRK